MRLAVLDASAVCGGPVTRAMEVASREAERLGADPRHVRLYGIFSVCCASCDACRTTGSCARRHEAIDAAAAELAAADLLLVGVTASVSQRDPRAESLLRRLVGSFGGVYDSRRADPAGGRPSVGKRAALVSSAPPLLGAAAALGMLPYGLGAVWRTLDSAGVDVVGCTAVARRWSGPFAWDSTRERATKLGRTLAARPAGQRDLRPVPARADLPIPSVRPRVA